MFSAIITGLKLANWLNWIVAIVLTGFFVLLLADAGGVRADIRSCPSCRRPPSPFTCC